jgi:hypothetical protein
MVIFEQLWSMVIKRAIFSKCALINIILADPFITRMFYMKVKLHMCQLSIICTMSFYEDITRVIFISKRKCHMNS